MNPMKKRLKLTVSSRGLRIWGLMFLLGGIISRAIVQNNILDVDTLGMDKIVEMLEYDPQILKFTTIAVLLQGIETMAAPIFAFLLVEGFCHSSNVKAYLIRMAGAALLAEIPYNLVTTGKFFELTTRNPMFAMVIGLIVLMFFSQYPGSTAKEILSKGMVVLGALLWCAFLGIQNALPVIAMVLVLWFFRGSRNKQVIFGIAVSMLCGLLSGYYFASALGMLMLLLYNGERSYSENKVVNYLSYPAVMLAVGIAAMFI